MNTTKTQTKIETLAKYLSLVTDDIEEGLFDYEENLFKADGCEYLVLTDDEADEKAKEYILDSIWAFNAEFIEFHSSHIDADTIRIIQEKCEDANEPIKRLIDDLDHFVEDAIRADGRGHFMSSYDGEEIEEGEFLIYRMN